MARIIDLLAMAIVAVVLLLPKATVVARPAFEGASPVELDTLAELQAERAQKPDDPEAAVRLADAHLGLLHPEWALSTLARFADRDDYRVHLALAAAHAERLESALAVAEAEKVDALCAQATANPPCAPGTAARGSVIRAAMKVLVDQGIDPAKDPARARHEVAKVLRTAHYGGDVRR